MRTWWSTTLLLPVQNPPSDANACPIAAVIMSTLSTYISKIIIIYSSFYDLYQIMNSKSEFEIENIRELGSVQLDLDQIFQAHQKNYFHLRKHETDTAP